MNKGSLKWNQPIRSRADCTQSGKLSLSRVPTRKYSKRAQEFYLHGEKRKSEEKGKKNKKKNKEEKREKRKGRTGSEGKNKKQREKKKLEKQK